MRWTRWLWIVASLALAISVAITLAYLPLSSPLWGVISAIAAVIAALAALVTIWFARETVLDSRENRREGHEQHELDVAQQRQLLSEFVAARDQAQAQHVEQITEFATARDQAQAQHIEQMAEQARVFEAELALKRIEQFQRIIDVLIDLADTVRNELRFSPPPWDRGDPTSRIPSLQARLRAALVILRSFGALVPTVTDQVAKISATEGATIRIRSLVMEAFREIEALAYNDNKLKLNGQ